MQQPFDLKGSSFTIPMLSLLESDMGTIAEQLVEKVHQAPSFFHNAPLVLNLGFLSAPDRIDLTRLINLVRELGFIPVGISNCTEEQQILARAMGLAVLTRRGGGRVPEEEQEEILPDEADEAEESEQPEEPDDAAEKVGQVVYIPSAATVLTEPVRSGQRVEAEQGDLIVLASVGSGAEVTAVGNIHIYGALRGRAFAGSTGDTGARIFCQQLEAELVAVAGYYLINETIPDSLRGKSVHIRLQSERIRISPL